MGPLYQFFPKLTLEPKRAMPRKKAKLIVAAHRAAEARRIVAEQHDLIGKLKAAGSPTIDAEAALQTYLSALRHLEDQEQKIKQESRAKRRETKKPPPG